MQKATFGRLVVTALLAGGALVAFSASAFAQSGEAAAAASAAVAAEPGVLIVAVEPAGPAAEAGLRRGDIVLAVEDAPVNSSEELAAAIQAAAAGDVLTLTVLHGDDERQLEVTLAGRNGGPFLGVQPFGPLNQTVITTRRVGPLPEARLRMMPGRATMSISATAGILIDAVLPDSPAAAADLRRGDLITAIDGAALQPQDDLAARIAEHQPGDEVMLTIQRGTPDGEELEVAVTLGARPDDDAAAYLGVQLAPAMTWMRTVPGPGGAEAKADVLRFFAHPGGHSFGFAPTQPGAAAPFVAPFPPMPPTPYGYGYGAPGMAPLPYAMPFVWIMPVPMLPYWAAPARPIPPNDSSFVPATPVAPPDVLFFESAPPPDLTPFTPGVPMQEEFEWQVMI